MPYDIDFKAVRRDADFETVLAAYDIELIKDGTKPHQYKALCPFHDDNNPSLGVNTEKNVFNCFSCEAQGNILEFVMKMDRLEARPAAIKIAQLCGLPGADAPERKRRGKGKPSAKPKAKPKPPPAAETPAPVSPPADESKPDGNPYNPPLSFELNLELDDALKVWLESRGIDHHMMRDFSLGRASKRSKSIGDRLAIPLHDAKGRLVGYCGRFVGDELPDKDTPKYKLPAKFQKELELFNLHRIVGRPKVLVVFESYLSVMRFNRHVPCVSPFGRSISPQQVELVRAMRPERTVVVFDGDEPGRTGAASVAGALAGVCWVRTLALPDGVKPHHLDWDDLSERLKEVW